MAFHVGQKVVCVDFRPTPLGFPVPFGKGQVLTIALIEEDGCLRIIEQPRDDRTRAYYPRRFRPVVERKTDISALTALLNPANHKKLEDVS